MRTGIAQLPLHSGKAPLWLMERMSKLLSLILELILREYGIATFLDKISDPFWFQALGNFLGFDWHSSGLTTTLCASLKKSIQGREKEFGIFIAGGKGRAGISTPSEIESYGWRYGFEPSSFIYASRMSAKVDNTCLQDGYSIYQHTFIFTPSGEWAVIQQGMNPSLKLARRYHWRGNFNKDFVDEPHSGIVGPVQKSVLNLVAYESRGVREAIREISSNPTGMVLEEYRKIKELRMGEKFNYRVDMDLKRFERIFASIYERNPQKFVELVELKGVGASTLRALTLLAHLIYGKEPSFKDPAVYSYAHGGKDGIPYSLNRKFYSATTRILAQFLSRSNPSNRLDIREFLRLSIS